MLSPRVFSCRLSKAPPFWSFKKTKTAYKRFLERATKFLTKGQKHAMFRTDVEKYFPSIDLTILRNALNTWGSDEYASSFLLRLLRRWQLDCNVVGLPIGPDASRILGNALLIPIDRAIEKRGEEHIRWMDDILIFGETGGDCEDVLSLTGMELAALRLRLSAEKTFRFYDPSEAVRHLRDRFLASMESWSRFDPDRVVREVRETFDDEIRDYKVVDIKRFRWIMKFLRNHRDSYASLHLAENLLLMNNDPKLSADYLSETGLEDPEVSSRVAERLFNKLEQPSDDRFEGLDLHLLRVLSFRKWGYAEGTLFETIARDESRRLPVRCWAWQAYAKTSRFEEKEACESALAAEHDPLLRRSIVVSLYKREHRDKRRARFLRHAEKVFPELQYTTRWVEAA